MKPGVKTTIDNTKAVLDALDRLAFNSVLVGVPEKTADARAAGDTGKINNAQLARIHEYGSPANNIPARSFLEQGILHAQTQVIADFREGAVKTLDSMNPKEADKALERAGMHAATQVQKEFTDNSWEPLKHPRPQKGRSHRKGTDIVERPLIDTGSLRQSITYVVRKTG
jgi:hypothetical protein